ncbi:MAG: nuclear transport factor 2 family protein [Fimbriimonadaceae bacterium]|nr:nuclear transport factor 2 family protein [Fimbriimonadaceae bacterium]
MTTALLLLATIGQATPGGPNLLNGQPKFWTDPAAKATYRFQNGVHEVTVTEPGPEPWGVQIFWIQERQFSGKKYRLSFGAKSTSGASIVVKCQGALSPFTLLGPEQTVPTSEDWSQHNIDIEVPRFTKRIAAPAFMLSSKPGTIFIRGISVKLIPCVSSATPINSEAEIFDWYDTFVARFKAGDIDKIVSAWAPQYVETLESAADPKQRSRNRQWWVDELNVQSAWKGKTSNGPTRVWVKKISIAGDTAIVDGFSYGSWKSASEGELLDGGYSFSHDFKDTWKKQADGWLLIKSAAGEYREPKGPEVSALDAGHQKIMSALKRG